jgi:hypothetical protein
MAGSAHTPGPWEVVTGILKNGHMAIVAGDYGIAKVWDKEPGKSNENVANANLIAAAPELLALVTEIYGFWADVDMSERQLLQAFARLAPEMNAAIAKAEGR